MKMKILWSILFPIGLLTIPLFVSAATHSAGTNVLHNGTISMVTTDGQLRPYTSAGAYLSYGFNSWNNVVQANSDDISLPTGNFIPPRDGTIICSDRGNDKGTCYLITNGQKAGFTSEDVFNQSGFNFKYALYGDVSFLSVTNNISNSTQAHLPGTLINDNGTIKLIGMGGTIGVPSMDTLQSWGYSLVNVVNANSADQVLPQTDVLTPRTGDQLAFNTATNNPVSPTPTFNPTPTSTSSSVIDVCKNIEGVQTVIPAGMVADGNGNCSVSTSVITPIPAPNTTTSLNDKTPPSVPVGLTSTKVGPTGITISWNASSDPNSPVTGYKVFRNGSQIAIVTSGVSYLDTNLSPSTTYTYTVSAYDPSNNISAQSSPYFATTSSQSPTLPQLVSYSCISTGIDTSQCTIQTDVPTTAHVYLQPFETNPILVQAYNTSKDTAYLIPILTSEGAKANNLITLSDNVLSTKHIFNLQNAGLQSAVTYFWIADATDAYGNTAHQIFSPTSTWTWSQQFKNTNSNIAKTIEDSIYCRLGIGQPGAPTDLYHGMIIDNFYSLHSNSEISCNQIGQDGNYVTSNAATPVSVDLIITNELLNNGNDKVTTLSQIRINDEYLNNIALEPGQSYTKTIPLSSFYLYLTTTRKSGESDFNGYRIKVGNLIVKDVQGQLYTTHPIN